METPPRPTDQTPPAPEGDEAASGRAPANRLRRLDRLATLMDEQFQLPVVRYRVGLDSILGLIPAGGDWVAWVASAYIIWEGARLGAPPRLLAVMAGHTAVDLVGGYVPAVGDVFDAAYKCNRRNVDLLKSHFGLDPEGPIPTRLPDDHDGSEETSSPLVSYLVAAGFLVTLLAAASLPLVFVWWLLQ